MNEQNKKLLIDACVFSVVFFILSIFSLYLSSFPKIITTLWISNVAGIALLLRYPLKQWILPLIGIMIANFLAYLLFNNSIASSAYFTIINLIEIIVSVLILVRYHIFETFDQKIKSAVILLLLTIFIAPAIRAIMEVVFFGNESNFIFWPRWLVGDGICMTIFLPIVLCLLRGMWKTELSNYVKMVIGFFITVSITYIALTYLPYSFILIVMPLLAMAIFSSVFVTLVISCLTIFMIFTWYNAGLFVPLLQQKYQHGYYIYLPTVLTLVPAYLLSVFMEILKRTEHELEVSENEFRSAMESSGVGIALVLLDGTWFKVNHALCEMLGYSKEELLKLKFQDITYPEDLPRSLDYMERLEAGEIDSYHIDKRYICKNGEVIWVHLSVSLVGSKTNISPYFVAHIEDITRHKMLELSNEALTEELYDEKERLNIILTSIADCVIATDKEGLVTFMNAGAEKITGWSFEEAKKLSHELIFKIINKVTLKPLKSPIRLCLDKKRAEYSIKDALLINKTGKKYDIQNTVSLLKTKDNQIIGSVLVFQNVTEARVLEDELNYHATHDLLTGLMNRREFEVILNKVLERVKSHNNQHVLCYLDLDNFKIVNDSAGHSAGDALLQTVAGLMHKYLRKSDILARLGGDEFGILLVSCSLEMGRKISEDIVDQINLLRFNWENQVYRIGASVGLVAIVDGAVTVRELLSEADMACYSAKDAGRNRVFIYEADHAEVVEQRRGILLASTLREATDNNRFVLYAQRIVATNPQKEVSKQFELLLRMLDEKGEVIPAGAFIPIAERFNLMVNIDRWVLTQVLEHYGEKIAALDNSLFSINLSAHSLNDPHFLPFLLSMIKKSAMPAERLCFEFTETAAMNQITKTIEIVKELQQLGCKISLDDFGAGLSSFTYLKNFSVNFIKIDGSFVKNVVDYDIDATIVESINEVAHRLGIKTVAEFVENQAILKIVTKIGVDYVQGYATGEPESLDKVIASF